jgi:hypothetical protein
MGWLFTHGSTLRSQIKNLSEGWERQLPNGTNVKTTCLARCYRGGSFSGNLWSVWERTFVLDGQDVQPAERWITLCLLSYQNGYGWGYKDMEESSGPYFYSCPLKYLDMVPVVASESWREGVRAYHARAKERRQKRKASLSK